MGWLIPGYNIYLHKVRLWNKLTSMHPDRLTKNIFERDWLKRYNNWSSELCTMFDKIDMSNVIYNQGVCSIKDAQRNFKILCANEWKESLSSYPKLRTYCKFKTMFSAEPYILTNIPKSKRRLLAQLRIGVLPLAIETGRYYRKAVEARVCMVCNCGIIEDELHFICHCHYYEHYRNELYLLAYNIYENSNFDDLADIDKFVFIMSSEKMVLKLAWFIQHSWRERQNVLFRY